MEGNKTPGADSFPPHSSISIQSTKGGSGEEGGGDELKMDGNSITELCQPSFPFFRVSPRLIRNGCMKLKMEIGA